MACLGSLFIPLDDACSYAGALWSALRFSFGDSSSLAAKEMAGGVSAPSLYDAH